MDGYSTYFYDGPNQYVDHKTAETLSKEVTKIITEQIGKSEQVHEFTIIVLPKLLEE